MAVELFSENSGMGTSPRISFSYDLSQTDAVPIEQQHFRSDSSSSIDFDFCVLESFQLETSADELFFDGKILPIQVKKKIVTPKPLHQLERRPPPPPLPPLLQPPSPQQRRRPVTTTSSDDLSPMQETKLASSESDEKRNPRSFWRFKRSNSLNCGSGYARTLCPLPLLSRSNSTGSASSVKRSSLSKDNHNQKQQLQKNAYGNAMKQSQSSSSSSSSSSSYHQKPPLKKTGYGSYGSGNGNGNGVRINPVLNVPPASLLGLGSIFSGGNRSKKK